MNSHDHSAQTRNEDSGSPSSPEQSRSISNQRGGGSGANKKVKRAPQAEGRRHLSCENCRIRKMRCSRTSPCLSCKMRGDECVWDGAPPNGSAMEDDIDSTQSEVNRLKKLVDLLLTRLEQQDQDVARHFPDGVLPPPPAPIVYSHSSSSNLPPSSHSNSHHPPYDPHHPYADSNDASYEFQGNSDIVVEGNSSREIGGGIVYPEYESRGDAAESSREVWSGYGVSATGGGGASGSVMAEYQSQYK